MAPDACRALRMSRTLVATHVPLLVPCVHLICAGGGGGGGGGGGCCCCGGGDASAMIEQASDASARKRETWLFQFLLCTYAARVARDAARV